MMRFTFSMTKFQKPGRALVGPNPGSQNALPGHLRAVCSRGAAEINAGKCPEMARFDAFRVATVCRKLGFTSDICCGARKYATCQPPRFCIARRIAALHISCCGTGTVRWSASTPPSMGLRASTRAGKQAHLLWPLPVGLYMLEMRRAGPSAAPSIPASAIIAHISAYRPNGVEDEYLVDRHGLLEMRCGLSRHFCNENIVASHDTQKDNQTILH